MTAAHRAAPGVRSGLLAGALLVGVLLLVLFGSGNDADSDDAAPPATPPSSTAPLAPSLASEEAFCIEFRRLAASQSEYVVTPDERGAELLREAADRLLEVGVPRTMTLPARRGYFTLLEGIYQSLGLSLDPAAVGALEEPVGGADAAFSSYLAQFCPA